MECQGHATYVRVKPGYHHQSKLLTIFSLGIESLAFYVRLFLSIVKSDLINLAFFE